MSAKDPLNNEGVTTSEPAENGLTIDDESGAVEEPAETPAVAENPWATPRQVGLNLFIEYKNILIKKKLHFPLLYFLYKI